VLAVRRARWACGFKIRVVSAAKSTELVPKGRRVLSSSAVAVATSGGERLL
jgi:hypothetical protein